MLPKSTNRPTRRQFVAAAGLALWPCGRDLRAEPTGVSHPKLAAYDELMTRFLREHKPPGAALAVSYHGRLVYARGFGLADVEKQEPVHPASLFRIASISKPVTATAVLRLIEKGRLKLDDKVFDILKLEPHLEPGAKVDLRLHRIEVQHCLRHTGGWDRDKSFDPMGAETAEEVARALKVSLPVIPRQIVGYMMGKPLDFTPGTAYAYSNFGYCVLGRVIQAVTKKPYEEYVTGQILKPLGITRMRLGKNLLRDRAPNEVKYYHGKKRTGRAISGPNIGKPVPLPYGVECIETMDANGGWIASAVDLVRFVVAFDDPKKCPVLSEESILTMFAPPPGPVGHGPKGKPKPEYYGCGWDLRPEGRGRFTKWHGGGLAGSNTFLIGRGDGIDWAVLFNSDTGPKGKDLVPLLDEPLHKTADGIKDWPDVDLFPKFETDR
jgi:N-acyl-D-amino-acid deacylase